MEPRLLTALVLPYSNAFFWSLGDSAYFDFVEDTTFKDVL